MPASHPHAVQSAHLAASLHLGVVHALDVVVVGGHLQQGACGHGCEVGGPLGGSLTGRKPFAAPPAPMAALPRTTWTCPTLAEMAVSMMART